MAQPAASLPLALTARRILRLPSMRVFRAWTEAAELKRWFAAAEGSRRPWLKLICAWVAGIASACNPRVALRCSW
jgi:hypothetical protein